jgi:phage tail sheath protein FI
MAQVSFPGVYIVEKPSGARTITGVATSIAMFVGMASSGPIRKPTRILSFAEYERTFSSDTSLGEMTTQVHQFFLNGGQQAFIMRIANGDAPAKITLQTVAGTSVLTLTAKSPGTQGNQLRARIDYDTPSPESSFNVTLYREVFDEGGNPLVEDEELIANVSMDAAAPRFVKTVMDQEATLASADIVGSPAVNTSFSASARIFVDDPAANAAILAAVNAVGGTGRLRVKIGTAFFDATVSAAAATIAGLQTAINAVAGANAVTVSRLGGALASLVISPGSASVGKDVTILPASNLDIAAKLTLGAGSGGIEVGRYANARPAPTGYVSTLGATAPAAPALPLTAIIPALQSFAGQAKANVTQVSVTGTATFTAGSITFSGSGATMAVEDTATEPSHFNVKKRLVTIAAAINAATTQWRAEVHGYRLALLPAFDGASAGTGHVLASSGGGGYNMNSDLFAPAPATVSNVAAYSLGSGTGGTQTSPVPGADGGSPTPGDYSAAYDIIRSQVDLFNILVLPKTAADPNARTALWPEASTFCNERRAFLVIDASADSDTIDEIVTEVSALRAGLVKDHSALYWPRIQVVQDDVRTFVDPSGSIAGVMARIDASRGVWKAPAGLDSDVRGALAVSVPMSDPENGVINPLAVNAIRAFPNGIVSWGARTMDGFDNSGNTDFKYVPVRRFELFIEESLVRGLKFAVFEPNGEDLWAQIRGAANGFMNGLFRQGAFAGRKASDSFFVKVDSETTTQTDINNGIVNVVVGFAPLKPAEFVVITIQQQAGQVSV